MPASFSFLWGGIMEQLKLYRISDKYIRYLKSRDHRVQDNKNRRRPYVGVVLLVGNYKYFVPMESPKPSHAKIKPGHHIMRIKNGNLGQLGFNNMIPVPEEAIICFNIDDEPDLKYAELLRRLSIGTKPMSSTTHPKLIMELSPRKPNFWLTYAVIFVI